MWVGTWARATILRTVPWLSQKNVRQPARFTCSGMWG